MKVKVITMKMLKWLKMFTVALLLKVFDLAKTAGCPKNKELFHNVPLSNDNGSLGE